MKIKKKQHKTKKKTTYKEEEINKIEMVKQIHEELDI